MSSHDCSVRGDLEVKGGVSKEQVRAVIQPFLTEEGRMDFDKQLAEGNIEFYGVSLSFSIDFYGYGGYQNDSIDSLIERLEEIVEGHSCIEVMDFDTADQDAACCPFFIASDESGRQTARLEYGIMQMADYVSPVVGKEAFEALEKYILALPRVTAKD